MKERNKKEEEEIEEEMMAEELFDYPMVSKTNGQPNEERSCQRLIG